MHGDGVCSVYAEVPGGTHYGTATKRLFNAVNRAQYKHLSCFYLIKLPLFCAQPKSHFLSKKITNTALQNNKIQSVRK